MLFLVIQRTFLFRGFASFTILTPKHVLLGLQRLMSDKKKVMAIEKTGEYPVCRHANLRNTQHTSVMFMREEILRVPEEMLINYFLGPWLVLKKFNVKTPTDLNNTVLNPLRLLLFKRELKILTLQDSSSGPHAPLISLE